jgi:hypothetical protein
MGVMMMVFSYLIGRTDSGGRTVIDMWADRTTPNRRLSTALSIAAVVITANFLYGAVFAPHLVAKLRGWETSGSTAPLFRGVPNQPLYGTASPRRTAGN